MTFSDCLAQSPAMLLEGALGERLKREYHLAFDEQIAMASLVYREEGRDALSALWRQYRAIAEEYSLPFLATTPTRRANKERMVAGGFSSSVIADNVSFLRSIQQERNTPMYVGGLMGCKGDAYTGEGALSTEEAFAFHGETAALFAEAGADFLYAGIMPTLPEATGMTRAMAASGLPYIISLTIEANGCLIDGTPIAAAIHYIDGAASSAPVCYMTNCVHPTIVYQALSQPINDDPVIRSRFWGIQANTSPLPYAELDNAVDLKSSPPEEFAEEMVRLTKFDCIRIWGGCCGTDHRHMKAVAEKITNK